MKIFGMGTDVVPVDRFAKLADSDEAIMNERLFTQDEANDLQRIKSPSRRIQAYAASFAVKESVFKALGTGLAKGMSWRDIEVSDIFGRCRLATSGRTAELFKEYGIVESQITCSSTSQLATAVAILLCEDNSHGA